MRKITPILLPIWVLKSFTRPQADSKLKKNANFFCQISIFHTKKFPWFPYSRRALGQREHWILTVYTQGAALNLNNVTQTHSIFAKNLENTFLGMPKFRAWSIFTLAMPQVKTEQIQNLALFRDCCKRPEYVISGKLSKSGYG